MSCCGGGRVDGDEPVARDEPGQFEDLRQRLSGIMPPLDVDWAAEATVNLSGVSGTQPGPSQLEHRSASVLGTFERRQSVPGAAQRQQSGEVLQWTDSRKLLEVAIAFEQIEPMAPIPEGQTAAAAAEAAGDLGWEAEWEEMQKAEQRLEGRLSKLKLEHCIMEGDGNCQFRAISYVLYGTQRHHPYVRRRAVNHIRQYPQDFEAFLGEDLRAYLEQMGQEGTWGDELTLRATCEALAVVVNVISSDESNWFLRYLPRSARPKHECFLTYIAPVHYNAVRRQHTGDRLRRSFGRQHSQLSRAVSTYQRQYGFPQSPHHLASAGLVG